VSNNKKHIDDLFREKLGTYSEVPPAEAWGDLDKKLDTLVPHIPSSPFRWLGHVGIVSVIAVLSVSLVQKFMGKKNVENNSVNEQVVNKLDNVTSNIAINNSTTNVAAVAVPDMAMANDESDNKNNSKAGVAMGVAHNRDNGNYTETAGEEYVEGVTRISREQAYAGSNDNAMPTNAGHIAGGAGSSYNGNNGPNNGDHNNVSTGLVSQYKTNGNQQIINNSTDLAQGSKRAVAPVPGNPKLTGMMSAASAKTHQGPDFNRWEAGVKGGYERGFDNNGATKFVIAPYLQYNLSKKVAIMTQPAVKYANNPVRTIGTPRTYYQLNSDAAVADRGTTTTIVAEGSSVFTYYHTKFRYTQSRDSIVKTEKTAASYMEYELPVLLKYAISDKSSVYGGVNMVYSQMKGVSEYTYTKAGVVKTIDTTISAQSVKPSAPATGDILTYSGTPFSEYNGPLYPATQVNQIRFGAMLGFTYEYSDRWLLDALVQQNPAKKDMRAGYNINAPLSSTYFRLSVGYKLRK
jgi:hypothetical protein